MGGPTCDPHGSAGRPRIERIRFDPIRFADPPRSDSPRPLRFARRHANRDCAVLIRKSLAASPFLPHFPPFSLKETPDLHSRRPKEASYVDLKMAPKKATSEDIGWHHGTALGSRHNYKCNYCGHTRQGGGVSRLKKHLAGGRLAGYHDVQGCKSVPAEVKRLMIEHLKGVRAETQRKRADRKMQERIISGRQRDEDDDDEPEIHAEMCLMFPSREGVLRVVDGDRRPAIGLVYAKIEAAKKKIRDVSPRYAHLVLDIVEDRWDRQMSRDLHMAAYYLHPTYHYALELSYEDDLTAAFTRMKSFREGVGSFAEPSAIAGRDRIDGGNVVSFL
ncbi:hypothetical protein Taro_020536 [Colocasia esculenta]|uniref:BED-type domain-containing protein n=1 Tax=Colocasia esculenta TaxID=4460 RepID=A0A843UWJ9_COLES|nr:hypothetical protein [Colocasia esculenta]